MAGWENCKKVLCVRPDNMGDVLMSAPAMTALHETFGCSISLLTSSMGRGVAQFIPVIDEIITWDVPWVKGTNPVTLQGFNDIVTALRSRRFDAAVIFTVFSQNPLPTALMLALAEIPLRLAYCRENPYHLLTHWVPDDEPYSKIRHQVQRDLNLVATVGANVQDPRITIKLPQNYELSVREKLKEVGVDPARPWVLFHPGVSEPRREYPSSDWIETGRRIVAELNHQVIITGAANEAVLANKIAEGIGTGAFSLAGQLTLPSLITLIRFAPLLISVNTGPVHIAAALQTKVIVLYALTNPQHTPWKAVGRVHPYSIPSDQQSRNEVLRHLQRHYFSGKSRTVSPDDILKSVRELLVEKREPLIDDIVDYGIRKTLNFQAP